LVGPAGPAPTRSAMSGPLPSTSSSRMANRMRSESAAIPPYVARKE
jgi:hypothetical protein